MTLSLTRWVSGVKVDTLRVGYHVEISIPADARLKAIRLIVDGMKQRRAGVQPIECATPTLAGVHQFSQQVLHVEVAGETYDVKRSADYPYGLEFRSGNFSAQVGWLVREDDASAPQVLLTFRSAFLAERPLKQCLAYAEAFVRGVSGLPPEKPIAAAKISRLDVAVDAHTSEVTSDWIHRRRVVMRGLKKNEKRVSREKDREDFPVFKDEPMVQDPAWYVRGSRFSGYEFGARGAWGIHLRIYDKWVQARGKTGAEHVFQVWERDGLPKFRATAERGEGFCRSVTGEASGPGSMWRFEYELGREPLKQLGYGLLQDLVEKGTGPLWAYLTQSWSRVTLDDWEVRGIDTLEHDEKGRIAGRRPESVPTCPLWLRIQAASTAEPAYRIYAQLKRGTDGLGAQIAGCLASAIVRNAREPWQVGRIYDDAMARLPGAVQRRFAESSGHPGLMEATAALASVAHAWQRALAKAGVVRACTPGARWRVSRLWREAAISRTELRAGGEPLGVFGFRVHSGAVASSTEGHASAASAIRKAAAERMGTNVALPRPFAGGRLTDRRRRAQVRAVRLRDAFPEVWEKLRAEAELEARREWLAERIARDGEKITDLETADGLSESFEARRAWRANTQWLRQVEKELAEVKQETAEVPF